MNVEEVELGDDSSDEDYIPAGEGGNVSEESSGGEVSGGEISGGEEDVGKRRRGGDARLPRKKRKNGKVKKVEEKEEEKENSETVEVVTEEERKRKSDSLWADFLRDCGPPAKKSQPLKPDIASETPSPAKATPPPQPKQTPPPKKLTQVLTFAGEEVKVETPVVETAKARGKTAGIGSLLSRLGKGGKLSTLEKSKLDWESFKSKEGINEDLATHNRGKSGYLEQQDFLSRTDARQFEIEKKLRSTQRSSLNR